MSTPADPPPSVPDLRLRGDPPRVMRLSRKTLGLLALLASAGIGGSLFYALQPNHRAVSQELYRTDGHQAADVVTSAPRDYGQIPKLGPPLPGDLGRPIVAAQQRGVAVEPPPVGGTGPAPADGGARANAAQARRQLARQERDAARTSKVFLGTGTLGAASMTAGQSELSSAPSARQIAAPSAPAAPLAEDAAENSQGAKRAFLKPGVTHVTESAERLSGPVSPYIVQAGSIIPAALVTGIRSDLPGQITAQVTQNVYDSPTGRILLIPQGSKLLGEYDSQVSFGQNRVLLAWDRLILPGGQSIALDRQPGADAGGYAGLQDRTNNHWGGIAKAALLSTILGVGAEAESSGSDDLVRAVREGTSSTINQAGEQIVRRQLNIQPTLTIRPGYPLRVIVTRDLILAPLAQEAR
ncbi:MAG: conjugal transfer protein TraI [Bradyrhizobium sp.]|nr:conjugal transfer protein TraI [Bradyrhizobium sp.]